MLERIEVVDDDENRVTTHLDVAVHAILPMHDCLDVFFNQVCNPWTKYLGHDRRSDVVRKCSFLYLKSGGGGRELGISAFDGVGVGVGIGVGVCLCRVIR